MTTAAIRQRLYEYIRFADDKKVKAIYDMVAEESNDVVEWWQDKQLLAEVNQTDAEMENGHDTGIPWSEAKAQLLLSGKK